MNQVFKKAWCFELGFMLLTKDAITRLITVCVSKVTSVKRGSSFDNKDINFTISQIK